MRSLTYIVLFLVPFTYLLNCLTTTAKSTTAQTSYTPTATIKKTSPDKNTAKKSTKRTVTISNNITQDMLTYYKFGPNHPAQFSVKINNQDVPQGQAKDIELIDNKVQITYEYEFKRGPVTRKGSKKVEFEVDTDQPDIDLSFSWESEWRVILAHAHPQTMTNVY
jgi:hypothetical protein